MKTNPLFKIVAAAMLAGLLTPFVKATPVGESRQVSRTGTYTTSRGSSGTTSSTTTRSPGAVTRQGSWTNSAGGTGSWNSQATWNKANQTATLNGSVTRPNGATATWQGTAQRTAPGVITSGGTITTSSGKVATFSATDTRTAPGTWDRQETITRANGTVVDRNVVTTVANGSGTRAVTDTLPNGQTVSSSASFSQTVSPAQAVPTP